MPSLLIYAAFRCHAIAFFSLLLRFSSCYAFDAFMLMPSYATLMFRYFLLLICHIDIIRVFAVY